MATVEDRKRIVRAIAVLAEAFSQKASDLLLEAYVQHLADIPPQHVEAAVQAAILGSKWFPKVFELRQMCGAANTFVSIEERAAVAWQAVRRAIRVYGSYRSVQFDDPFATAAVRAIGGWVSLCEVESGDKLDTWKAKEFATQYQLVAARGIDAEEAGVLFGVFGVNRYTIGDPVIVIQVGLPEPDKKLIRGVIQTADSYVAIPEPAVESLVTTLGVPALDAKREAPPRHSQSRDEAKQELVRLAKLRGWNVEREDSEGR